MAISRSTPRASRSGARAARRHGASPPRTPCSRSARRRHRATRGARRRAPGRRDPATAAGSPAATSPTTQGDAHRRRDLARDRGRDQSPRVRLARHRRTTRPSEAVRPELKHDEHGFIAVDPLTLQTSLRGVWAGGACAFGHRTIAHAVADGKKAAWHIHAALTKSVVEPLSRRRGSSLGEDEWDGERAARAIAARRVDNAASTAPPADPFSSSALRDVQEIAREASRCFDCSVLPVIADDCTKCGACIERMPGESARILERRGARGRGRQREMHSLRRVRGNVSAGRDRHGPRDLGGAAGDRHVAHPRSAAHHWSVARPATPRRTSAGCPRCGSS